MSCQYVVPTLAIDLQSIDTTGPRRKKRLQMDILSMNKRAVQNGYTTAREFSKQFAGGKRLYREAKRVEIRHHLSDDAARKFVPQETRETKRHC